MLFLKLTLWSFSVVNTCWSDNIPFYYQFWDVLQTALILCQFFFLHQDSLFCIYNPKTLKHWVGIQRGQSYLRLAPLALVSHPSSDSATIKIIYGVDAYYIYQPCTPSFPIGLVKTESHVIVRSVETGFRRKILILFWLSQTLPVTLRIQE